MKEIFFLLFLFHMIALDVVGAILGKSCWSADFIPSFTFAFVHGHSFFSELAAQLLANFLK
jgi:hypothetical protein